MAILKRNDVVNSLESLGQVIRAHLDGKEKMNGLDAAIERAGFENGWFTAENVRLSLRSLSSWLRKEDLHHWLEGYPERKGGNKIGIIMAGNIPLVGFHDLLCTLLSGHKAEIKMSSSDKVLLPFITTWLISTQPRIAEFVNFTERLNAFDAVIATGSNNSARYFEYYFGSKPHIIRKNRNSLAVLSGDESEGDLSLLANDIFSFFGLGCRSVSKLMIPAGFDLNRIFASVLSYGNVIHHNKYAANYDYQRACYLMGSEKFLDNGFLLLRENASLQSAVATLHYEYYAGADEVSSYLQREKEKIQSVVTTIQGISSSIPFGMSQCPSVDEYADGINTMKFLTSL